MIILKTFLKILPLKGFNLLLIVLPIFVQLSMCETILVGRSQGSLGRRKIDTVNNGWCDCRRLKGENSFRHERIFGGKPAAPGQFPYQAKIELFNLTGRSTFDHICGGVLISSSHVLTAAHCLPSAGVDTSLYQVILGDGGNTRYTHKQAHGERKVYKIKDFVKHRRVHAGAQNDNDIAMLKIEDVECDANVQPICLGGPTFPPNSHCQISGYGVTEEDKLSDRLLYATVQLHSHQTCQNIHNERGVTQGDKISSSFKAEHITPNMLCAGPMTGIYDACFGDSGGGLSCYSQESQLTYLAGIASWGKACGTHPSVYTKVSQYKDWIHIEMQLMG